MLNQTVIIRAKVYIYLESYAGREAVYPREVELAQSFISTGGYASPPSSLASRTHERYVFRV